MNMMEELNFSQPIVDENADPITFTSKMTLSSFHAQPQGFLNGGATLAFCETTSGFASYALGKGSYQVLGQTVIGNHLNPKKSEGFVIAYGTLLHKGGRSHVWEIKVRDENGLLISQVTVTNALIYNK